MKNLFFIMIMGSLIALAGCTGTTKVHKKTADVTVEQKASDVETAALMSEREIQIALKNAGYYQGAIDGILGSRSRDAIRKFQQDNGLKDDSIAGPRTQDKLRKYINTEFKP